MSKFQKIYDFFSGEMSEIEEKVFFEELSKDDNLRAEFNNHKKINDTINRNEALESAPISSKESLFMNLGLDIPAGTSTIGAFSLIKNKWLSGLSYLGVAVLSGAIIYFLINKGIQNNFEELNNKLSYFSSENGKLNEEISKLKNDLNINKNYYENKLEEEKNNIKIVEKIIYKNKYISDNKADTVELSNNINPVNNDNKNKKEKNIMELNYSDILENNYFHSNNEIEYFKENKFNKINKETGNNSLLNDFSFEFTNNVDFYNISPKTTPFNFNSFNNNSLSIYYNAYKNLDIGLNVIGENYSLKYINTEDDGDYWYYQTPNYITTSLVGKYRLQLTDNFYFSPYASSGFNRNGLVLRGGVSFQYMFYDIIGISLNSQYSNMIFENNNTIFNSGKTSIQVGMIWKK